MPTCPVCLGSGEYESPSFYMAGPVNTQTWKCPYCSGTGEVRSAEKVIADLEQGNTRTPRERVTT